MSTVVRETSLWLHKTSTEELGGSFGRPQEIGNVWVSFGLRVKIVNVWVGNDDFLRQPPLKIYFQGRLI